MPVTLLKIKVLSKRIDPNMRVEIQYSCTEHIGIGTVRLTHRQWREMANNVIASQLCATCAKEAYETAPGGH